MAWLFDDTSSDQYFQATAVPSSVAAPLTMAAWTRTDDLANNGTILAIADASVEVQWFALQIKGTEAGDPIWAQTRDATGNTAQAASTTGVSVNTWHHICGVFASTTSRTAYIDGGSAGTDVTSVTPTGLDTTSIGRLSDFSPSSYVSGDIAEVAIWDVALTATEVAMLANGYSPLFVRPGSLISYWPMIRNSPLLDRVGGVNLTIAGSPTVSAHPRIIYPRRRHIITAPSAVVGDGSVIGGLISTGGLIAA